MVTTVLVVDDEPGVADRFARVLDDEYAVRTAYSGREALEAFDATVDVALLDRRMPDLAGREVLTRMREVNEDCQVAMITAISADFDVVDLPVDEYVTKPVRVERLRETVEALVARSEFDAVMQEYASLVARRAALEREKSAGELTGSPEYRDLTERIARLDAKAEETFEKLDDRNAFAAVDGHAGWETHG